MSKIGEYKLQPSGIKTFIPNKFTGEKLINWDDDLIMLHSDADRALGKLSAIYQLVPDVSFFIFMFVRKEAALSSQIEGTQATLIDVVKAEAKIASPESPSDVDEIINYIAAMNYGMERLNTLPLSLRMLREFHQRILFGVRGKDKRPGEFRDRQNWVGGPTIQTATFVPPPPDKMLNSLYELEKFMGVKGIKLPPLIRAGLIHAQFETIHPFLDGNGRTGRLLITFYLHKEGYLAKPLLYISDFFKKNLTDYYNKLNSYRFDKDGVEQWLKFFLVGIKEVSEEAVITAQAITELRKKHTEIVRAFGRNADTALKLLEKLYSEPVVNAKIIAKITGLSSRSTVNELIKKFEAAGILVEINKKGRSKSYWYEDYFNLFHRNK